MLQPLLKQNCIASGETSRKYLNLVSLLGLLLCARENAHSWVIGAGHSSRFTWCNLGVSLSCSHSVQQRSHKKFGSCMLGYPWHPQTIAMHKGHYSPRIPTVLGNPQCRKQNRAPKSPPYHSGKSYFLSACFMWCGPSCTLSLIAVYMVAHYNSYWNNESFIYFHFMLFHGFSFGNWK